MAQSSLLRKKKKEDLIRLSFKIRAQLQHQPRSNWRFLRARAWSSPSCTPTQYSPPCLDYRTMWVLLPPQSSCKLLYSPLSAPRAGKQNPFFFTKTQSFHPPTKIYLSIDHHLFITIVVFQKLTT